MLAGCLFVGGCASSPTSPSQTNSTLPSGTIYFSERSIKTLRLSDGTVTNLADGGMPNVRPDRSIVAVVATNLALISPDGTQATVIIPKSGQSATGFDASFKDPQVSPDGRYIAYCQRFYDMVYVYDAKTNTVILSVGNISKSEYFTHPSWGKDGSLFVEAVPFGTIQAGGGIYRIDNTFQTIVRVDHGLNTPKKPTVSPDGTTIAFVLNSHVWTMGIDGSNARQLTTSSGTEDYPTWSPDSKWIAINDGACDLFLIPIGGGSVIDLHNQYPNSIGGSFGHCPDPGGQMDWK